MPEGAAVHVVMAADLSAATSTPKGCSHSRPRTAASTPIAALQLSCGNAPALNFA